MLCNLNYLWQFPGFRKLVQNWMECVSLPQRSSRILVRFKILAAEYQVSADFAHRRQR